MHVLVVAMLLLLLLLPLLLALVLLLLILVGSLYRRINLGLAEATRATPETAPLRREQRRKNWFEAVTGAMMVEDNLQAVLIP